jgi:hypothetical protein
LRQRTVQGLAGLQGPMRLRLPFQLASFSGRRSNAKAAANQT